MLAALLALADTPTPTDYDLTCAASGLYLAIMDEPRSALYYRIEAFYEGRLSAREPDRDIGSSVSSYLVFHPKSVGQWQATMTDCAKRYTAQVATRLPK